MTAPVWIASALLAGQLRMLLGDAAAIAPSAAVAWTVLYARRSFRGSFALVAVLTGLCEGPTYDAPFVAAPLAALFVGALASATRRIAPIRRPRGEIALGVVFAALAATAVDLLRERSAGPWASFPSAAQTLAGAVATGLCAGLCAFVAERSPSLRAALARR
jgi:hypothetical protein